MRREAFRTAYRAGRWTLRNKGLSSLSIALPRDIADRKAIYAVLVDCGRLADGAGEGLPALFGDTLEIKARYMANAPGGLIDLKVLRLLFSMQIKDPRRLT
jgi:hypothetical protein